ncbi:hypothetical protein [Nocardioides panaciterrulae]|uniref:Uncharacterized protein n=1 Tax=Nocardioides panaciterrulae TaxID=661492 RepID=A0A7Y9E9Z3_9ACTN|nr:hypothetical protein [Nocardioides panaciterrulae]NYD43931.1 hypothetical protein [Nocardioides panaciterrulae]NYD44000.1 hypothetical protein [Nocardioides panaciterrulae]
MIEKSTMGTSEVLESLTGYDEQEIEARFGAMPDVLLTTKPSTGLRALAMVVVGRDLDAQEIKDAKGKAYRHVMGLTLAQVSDFFPDDVEEVDPDEPETPAGEGDSSAD